VIVKERSVREFDDPRQRAGEYAERQMAFYLDRAFRENCNVGVLHDLRISRNGDVSQIDHLLVHRSGAIIVESKSVSTRVRVNRAGEWERWFDGMWFGMPSPVEQARRQANLLKKYLSDNSSNLLGKLIGIAQKGFGCWRIDVVVAISDAGVIEREPGVAPEVIKADLVCDRLLRIIEEQRTSSGVGAALFGRSSDLSVRISDEEVKNVCAFLTSSHRGGDPIHSIGLSSIPKLASISPAQNSEHSCPKCRSTDVRIQYGKFGYYWKCGACSGNSKLILPGSGKLRKDGRLFFYCAPDGSETLFHSNSF